MRSMSECGGDGTAYDIKDMFINGMEEKEIRR